MTATAVGRGASDDPFVPGALGSCAWNAAYRQLVAFSHTDVPKDCFVGI